MIDSLDKTKCTGCTACEESCPKQAIYMHKDEEGFLYPIIDYEKCIKCRICDKVCQSLNPLKKGEEPRVYGAINNDEKNRMNSSSGGIFSLLAKKVITDGGVVFGAAFNDELNVRHIAIGEEKLIYKLQGSKYVQSLLGSSFKEVKDLLENDRYVLFVGTPCQINGLLHFLQHDYEKLYTMDFICHGVPSPKVWQLYLEELKKKYGKVREGICTFRAKDKGWINFSIKIPVGDGYIREKKEDPYMKAFMKNLSLRPSCYNCNSKGISRNSDITVADFWAIKRFNPDLFDDKGASLVFIQSDKGEKLFELISKDIRAWEVNLDNLKPYIVPAYKSVDMNKSRQNFMKEVGCDVMENLVNKYGKTPLSLRVKIYIASIIHKIIGKKSTWE